MKVYFIGAGPGAPDLITLRGARLLAAAPLVLYAGSLVDVRMLDHCRADAERVDTSRLDLEEQEAHYRRAQARGWDVARLHSGDPAIYGAAAEQMRRLDALGIAYEVVPGVSSFTACAAVLGAGLTRPGAAQTVILTRTPGRASPVPPGESLRELAAHRATLCVFLSGASLPEVVAELAAAYPPETPAALVQKATWPQETVVRGTLGSLLSLAGPDPGRWRLSTMLLVGDALANDPAAAAPPPASRLYALDFSHRFRRGRDARAADRPAASPAGTAAAPPIEA